MTNLGLSWSARLPILRSCYFIADSVDLVHILVTDKSEPTKTARNRPNLGIRHQQVQGYKTVLWPITPTVRYPADCNCPNPGGLVDPGLTQGAETIMLVPPGSRLTPRLNQFDLGFRKVFHVHEKFTIMSEAQFFNVTNSNAVLTESYTLGSSIKPYAAGGPGGRPTAVLNPRMTRLNLQFKF
jgi:hypothetical protein